MPTIEQASHPLDPEMYEPVEAKEARHVASPPQPNSDPGFNPFLRCPLPPVGDGGRSDSLRQFYRDGVPQQRLWVPQ